MKNKYAEQVLRKAPFDSDRAEVESLIAKGWSDTKIADHYGVRKYNIWSRRKRWGLGSGSEQCKRTFLEEMTLLWQKGYSPKEMAELLNTTLQRIYVTMRDINLRAIPRMGLNVKEISSSDVGRYITEEIADDLTKDRLVVVTHRRQPRYVLVPVEEYTDLLKQNFSQPEPVCSY